MPSDRKKNLGPNALKRTISIFLDLPLTRQISRSKEIKAPVSHDEHTIDALCLAWRESMPLYLKNQPQTGEGLSN